MEQINDIVRRSTRPKYLKMAESNEGVEGAEGKEVYAEKIVDALSVPVLAGAKYRPSTVVCSKCHGAGYLRANVPFGHPSFGKPIACECKEAERKARERQRLVELSQLEKLQRFRLASFDSYDFTQPGVLHAYRAALKFAARPKGWLVMVGPNGCGKTHLAVSIAKEQLAEEKSVLVQTAPDLLDYLRSAFNPHAEEVYDQLFARLRAVDLLVLDDLGAEQSTAWANTKLFQLLNYRYNAEMTTVITSNSLEWVDERIKSRLGDRALVNLIMMNEAKDYRPNYGSQDQDEGDGEGVRARF